MRAHVDVIHVSQSLLGGVSIDRMAQRYGNAMDAYLSGNYTAASDRLRDLIDFYPANQDSTIRDNLEEHLRTARLESQR